jgi:hypothetical protein
MTGGTWTHAAIQRNLIGLLYNCLRGHRCQAFGSELKIQTGYSIRYPDAFVVCSPATPGALVVTDPVIVFEILSESTSYIDRIDKNREYRGTSSIQRYVILEQTKPAATVTCPVWGRLGGRDRGWRCGAGFAGDRGVLVTDRIIRRDPAPAGSTDNSLIGDDLDGTARTLTFHSSV